MAAWVAVRKAKEFWGWLKFVGDMLGLLGLLGIITGLGASIGGAVWAAMIGVPLPVAIMAGYCTLVGAVYLAMAPLIYRALAKPARRALAAELPDFAPWRHVHQISIRDAAYLWCNIYPVNRMPIPPEVLAWVRALAGAVHRSELNFVRQQQNMMSLEQERAAADWQTIVTRDGLRAFARAHNHDPAFLRD